MGSGLRFGLRRSDSERYRWSMMPSHSDTKGRGGFTLTEHTLTREQYMANEAAIDAQVAKRILDEVFEDLPECEVEGADS